jgi:hypothetical protein
MLDELTEASFKPHSGTRFQVLLENGPGVELDLAEVTLYPHDSSVPRKREPFSLLFRGPAAAYLPQRIYRLQHPEMGSLDLFLVPIRREGDTLLYEAVFN